jgi:phytoene dehydrogenase-like protein
LGYRAELFEKNAVPGGECTGWDRSGYHIDNCIHWLMGTTPGRDLYDLYRETRLIDESTGMLKSDVMYMSWLNGQHLSLYSDLAKTRKEWIALSPEDEEEIDTLFDNVALGTSTIIPAGVPSEQLGGISGIGLLMKLLKMFKLFGRYRHENTLDLMRKFKHSLIRRCG